MTAVVRDDSIVCPQQLWRSWRMIANMQDLLPRRENIKCGAKEKMDGGRAADMSYNDALLGLCSLLSITLHLYESKRAGSRLQSQVFAPAVLLEPAAVNACFACLAPLSLPLLLCCALLCSAAVDGPHVALATRLSGGDLSISRSFCHPSLPF